MQFTTEVSDWVYGGPVLTHVKIIRISFVFYVTEAILTNHALQD